MTREKKPNGNWFRHTFDAIGRVTDIRDLDPDPNNEGGHWNYDRQVDANGDADITVTTAEGDITTYQQDQQADGGLLVTVTGPSGAASETEISSGGKVIRTTASCGMESTVSIGADPMYKTDFVESMTASTPSGLFSSYAAARAYVGDDRINDTISVDGNDLLVDHLMLDREIHVLTAGGRSLRYEYDSNFLPRTVTVPDVQNPAFAPVTYEYDLDDQNQNNDRGQVTAVIAGTRRLDFAYYTNGRLESVTDAAGRAVFYQEYDAVG
ncbi:MAG: hypothetical protein HYV26_20075, partial [Candidatus Hydrogenedentes bacterium]|nr:hypothetical protein [Candidatus Hydrogenedentota bacterium]